MYISHTGKLHERLEVDSFSEGPLSEGCDV